MGFWDFITGSTPAGVISETGQKVVTGIFDGVGSMIDRFHLSETDKQQFKLELAKLQLESYKTQITDIQSARQMQMTNRSIWPGVLTVIMTLGFYSMMGILIFKGLPSTNETGGQALLLVIGSVVSGFGMMLSFWFGSTQGSQNKDQMLMNSIPVPTTAQIAVTPTSTTTTVNVPPPQVSG
jgi:hypothetical protein